ncbi:MAG: PD40 domain-containing protein [Sedimentisphaerales bacterium]|nr:PD40 domain-containing protein [Sedimentisphaerales bacterium]
MKARCDFRGRLLFAMLLVAWALAVEQTHADFVFGPPENLGMPFSSPSGEGLNCVSADGREMYFDSYRAGTFGNWDIWWVTRNATSEGWGEPTNLGPLVNTAYADACACISADGLELYFSSNRPGGCGADDLWMMRRPTTDDPWAEPVNLGETVNSPDVDFAPWITTDGLELYFSSRRAGGFGSDDLWVARRPTAGSPWEAPMNLGSTVNSPESDAFPFVTVDGLCLLFSGDWQAPVRTGGLGDVDIWMARRPSTADPWGAPANVGAPITGPHLDCQPVVAPDGSTLYFCSERPGGLGGIYGDIYQATITPVVDFNADGVVDIEDLRILIDCWGQSDPSVDIGPMPWGDGIVDVNDLKVLIRHWGEVVP